jgi:hypothetical protein
MERKEKNMLIVTFFLLPDEMYIEFYSQRANNQKVRL